MGGGQLTQFAKGLFRLHQVLISHWLPVQLGEPQVAQSVKGVRGAEWVASDRVAVRGDRKRVEGRGQLGQCIDLLQTGHVGAVKNQRLCVCVCV